MVDSKQWLIQNIDLVVALLSGLLIVMLILFIVSMVRMAQVRKRYRNLMKGLKDANLEEILFQYTDDVQRLEAQVQDVVTAQDRLQHDMELSIGPVGVLRYNAFPDAGSDLSYSIALLNRDADGVVLSSIFGREESRTYAKPIVAGASSYKLSEEEQEAIHRATQQMMTKKAP
ncbi:DUF4446 family protein [Tumebacillus permanentifrigoris]|uniref:Uncharacterized protein DUF4446 n=1 Tax=Tumebacillus permanentifrigoris TaxID=378543 RepID=A0A316DEE5_9BACL|nr:DUF4446 family protein [Tumebacillus permanentifrigoris]PWK16597.1 uncharacterized protein DUF4446 [Tumebacillus permanentifrigoris]